jgi:hypothetical protein
VTNRKQNAVPKPQLQWLEDYLDALLQALWKILRGLVPGKRVTRGV